MDSICLDLLYAGNLSEPDGEYQGFAITEAGREQAKAWELEGKVERGEVVKKGCLF